MIHHSRKRIRFAHCDPAGIVFYPRYAELCNEVVEDWFRDGVGIGFPELHEVRRLGIPAVRLEVDYLAPSRYGDVLDFGLSIVHLGRTSMHLALEAGVGDATRVRFSLKVVLADLATLRPTPIEGELRERLLPYLQPGAQQ